MFLKLWPFTHLVKKLSPYPPFRQIFAPLVRKEVLQVTFLPVGEEVPFPENLAVPRAALERLIRESSHRFLYKHCICRVQEGCREYPHDLGCIFLGDAAAELHPSLGRLAGVEECLERVERAAKLGLVGMIGHLWMDATALGVLRKFDRFLAVCFCCDCCCMVRTDLRRASPEFKDSVQRLQAVRVEVKGNCAGCGTCVDGCFIGAVSLRDGRAYIDQDACKGCGMCAERCPREAIQVTVADEDDLWKELLERVRAALPPS